MMESPILLGFIFKLYFSIPQTSHCAHSESRREKVANKTIVEKSQIPTGLNLYQWQ